MKTGEKILAVLMLMAKQAGVPEQDIRQAWQKTPEAPLLQPAPVPEAPPAREKKRGLDLLFAETKEPMRHICPACQKTLVNRRESMRCPGCSMLMKTTAIEHGKRGRKKKVITDGQTENTPLPDSAGSIDGDLHQTVMREQHGIDLCDQPDRGIDAGAGA